MTDTMEGKEKPMHLKFKARIRRTLGAFYSLCLVHLRQRSKEIESISRGTRSQQWSETSQGLPQGASLSSLKLCKDRMKNLARDTYLEAWWVENVYGGGEA